MSKQKKPKCGKGQSCGWACIEASDVCTDRISTDVATAIVGAIASAGVNVSEIRKDIREGSTATGTFDEVLAKTKLTASSPTQAIVYKGGAMYRSFAKTSDGQTLQVVLIEHGEGKNLKRYTVADGFLKEVTASGGRTTAWMEAVQASVRAVAMPESDSPKSKVEYAGHDHVPLDPDEKIRYLNKFIDEPEFLKDAVETWSGGGYGILRRLDRGESVSDEESRYAEIVNTEQAMAYNEAIDAFLARAPKFKGEIYRGIHVEDEADFQKIMTSDTLEMDAKSSFSSDSSVAKDFSRPNFKASHSVNFTVKQNSRGVSIRNLSEWDNEDEVLVPKGTRYRVAKRTVTDKPGSQFKNIDIELEEIND